MMPVQKPIEIDRTASEIDALTIEISSIDNLLNAALSDLGIRDPPLSENAPLGSVKKPSSGIRSGSIGSKSERLEKERLDEERLDDDLIDFVSVSNNGQITDIQSVKRSSISNSSKGIKKDGKISKT